MTILTDAEAVDLLARLLADIAPEVDLHDVAPDVDFQVELGLDSMDFLNLMIAIKDEVGIEVPERDYPKMLTVEGAAAYLVQQSRAAPGG